MGAEQDIPHRTRPAEGVNHDEGVRLDDAMDEDQSQLQEQQDAVRDDEVIKIDDDMDSDSNVTQPTQPLVSADLLPDDLQITASSTGVDRGRSIYCAKLNTYIYENNISERICRIYADEAFDRAEKQINGYDTPMKNLKIKLHNIKDATINRGELHLIKENMEYDAKAMQAAIKVLEKEIEGWENIADKAKDPKYVDMLEDTILRDLYKRQLNVLAAEQRRTDALQDANKYLTTYRPQEAWGKIF